MSMGLSGLVQFDVREVANIILHPIARVFRAELIDAPSHANQLIKVIRKPA